MGTPYVSSNAQLFYAREGTYGTRPTAFGGSGGGSTVKVFGLTTEAIDFPDKKLEVKKYRDFGAGRTFKRLQAGARSRDGSIPIVLTSGEIISYAMGFDDFTTGTHTLRTNTKGTANGGVSLAKNLGRAILPSFSWSATMFDDASARTFQRVFLGSVIDNASFEVSETSELMARLSIKSQKVDDDISGAIGGSHTAISATLPDSRPYLWYDSTVTVFGTTLGRPQSFSTGISNKLKTKYYLTQGTGQDPAEYLTSYPDFNFKMDFVPAGFTQAHGSESVYHLIENAASTLFETRGDVSVTLARAGDVSDTIQFNLYDCMFSEAPHSWGAEGNEMVVPCTIEPRELEVVVKDGATTYLP